jgi:hypothetical protein
MVCVVIAFAGKAPYNIPHMGLPKVYFPQFTRVFSALLWVALIAFCITNLIARRNTPSILSQLLFPSIAHPFSISQHVTTAKTLWDSGYKQTATHELVIAADLVETGGAVLGATSDPIKLLSLWESEPLKLKSAYDYWSSITVSYPDYRDGFLMTATFAYQLGKTKEANQMMEKAYALDPNYKSTTEMLKKIEH